MRKVFVFIFIFIFYYSSLLAFPEGVYPISSTRQEVEPGIWIVQGTDGRWYQETGQDDDGNIMFEGLTGKEDVYIDLMESLEDIIGGSSSSDVPIYEDTNYDSPYYNDLFNNDNSSDGFYLVYIDNYKIGNPQYAYGSNVYYYYGCNSFVFDGNICSFSYNSMTHVKYLNNQGNEINETIDSSIGSVSFDMSSTSGMYELGGHVPVYQTFNWYTNYYDGFTPSGGANDFLEGHYIGYGDPNNDVPPEHDPNNKNGENYIPSDERVPDLPIWGDNNTIFSILRNILSAIKYNTAVVIQKTDLIINQLKNGSLVPDNQIVLPDVDVNFLDDVKDEDNWFVKLLKAIAKFFSSLIVPGNIVINNIDGSTKEENYFTYNFNQINTQFSSKFGYEDYVTGLESFVVSPSSTNTPLDPGENVLSYEEKIDSSDEDGEGEEDTLINIDSNNFVNFSIWDDYFPTIQGWLRGFFYALLVIYNIKMVQVLIRTTSPIKTGRDD